VSPDWPAASGPRPRASSAGESPVLAEPRGYRRADFFFFGGRAALFFFFTGAVVRFRFTRAAVAARAGFRRATRRFGGRRPGAAFDRRAGVFFFRVDLAMRKLYIAME